MKEMHFNSIICFGEVLWDMLPEGAQPGGAPMNVAVHLTDNLKKLVEETGLLVFGSLAARNQITRRTLLRILENTPAIKMLDVNLRSPYDKRDWIEALLHKANFVKLNDDELIKIARWNGFSGNEIEMVMWLSEFFRCPQVCVTRGANGALLLMEGQIIQHPGFKVNAVDTVGAGDAFLAGLIAKLSEEYAPEQALEFACATGAFVASQNGAVPAYSQDKIESMFR